MVTLLDGPLGTQLLARGVPTPTPLWSAWALRHRPEVVLDIHRDYVEAGAQVHTANTFRTRSRTCGDWERLTRRAVGLARAAGAQQVAGSIAPLEDCYRPDLSPSDPGAEHREMAEVLADAGCDLLLCEAFPHPGEALVAVDAAVATGRPTWLSLTAGPEATLLTPEQVGETARAARDRGAQAVLVNCVPASRTLAYIRALSSVGLPFGAYANAGHVDEAMGWAPHPQAPARYLAHAQTWVDEGATLIGSCCGTGPAHTRALQALMPPKKTFAS